jgi:hypothetical protein
VCKDKREKNLKIRVLILCVVFVSGCSLFQPPTQEINVYCTQQDGVVFVNGNPHDCPVIQTKARRDKTLTISAQKPGFEGYEKTVKPHMNKFYYIDTLGALIWLVPVFGIMSPGAWDLDQTDFYVSFYPSAEAKQSTLPEHN